MKRQRLGSGIVTAAILLAALGVLATAPAGAAAPPAVRAARRAALRDVYRRLVRLRLPPSAHPVRRIGRGLHLESPGTEPGTPNLVQMHSFFLSPWPRERLLGWLEKHPPAGAQVSQTGSFGIGKRKVVQYVGLEFGETKAIGYREMQFGVAARPGGGSALRVDSQAVWTTPRGNAEKIPAGVRFIGVKVHSKGRVRKSILISAPDQVRSIVGLVDGFGIVQPGEVSCPELGYPKEEVTLAFRHSRRGPALAETAQLVPPGCGRPLDLTIHGKKQTPLEEGWVLLKRLRPLLEGASARASSTTSAGTAKPLWHPPIDETQARNRATLDAEERIDRVRMPPGSKAVPRLPGRLGLGKPPTPRGSRWVDLAARWRASLPPARLVAYLRAHPPKGASVTDEGTNIYRGVPIERLLLLGWYRGNFQAENREGFARIVPDGRGSAVRVDVVASWQHANPKQDIVPTSGFLKIELIRLKPEKTRQIAEITDRATIASVAEQVNTLPFAGPETEFCGEPPYEGVLRLHFRQSAEGKTVAAIDQQLPACYYTLLPTIHGNQATDRREGDRLIEAVEPLLSPPEPIGKR